jgi:hypothetical protein
MSLEQLEKDVAELKVEVAELLARFPPTPDVAGPDPYTRWWESLGPPLSGEAASALDDMEPFARYFRQTGEWPPPAWKPGDPIPEPDHWK